ncbi:MAG: 1-acyl-sn-glycerol-3-phosphate acyltransferase [Bacilli bacterium]|nr:1-acyl-sn-glycerol-3-phosphate acyltransferase [Bacilli bacterium]
MWIKNRHKFVFKFLKGPFVLFFKLKYNFKAVKYKLEKKPYLILSNHLTTLDPFMVAASFSRPIYYMANADLFSNRFGKIIEFLVKPIPKNKNVKELGPIKDCLRIVKEGGTIGVFPEGNRSYSGELCYISDAIAKLVKLLKIDVVLYNIHGGYGIDPRWGYKARRGRSYGCVKRILTKEEIATLSTEELFAIIKEELTVPQVPSTIKYKNRNNALGLERVLYLCPVCGKVQTIETHKNNIKCTSCGLDVKYNEYLEFESNNEAFKFKYVKDWYNHQVDYIKNFDISTEGVIFEDNITLYRVPNGVRPIAIMSGKIQMDNLGFSFVNEEQKMRFEIKDISDITVLGRHKLNFFMDKEIYQIKGDKTLNVLKYMHMYYHIKNTNTESADEFLGM